MRRPMPPALRFVLLLSLLAALAAPLSLVVLRRQEERQAQVTAESIARGHVAAGKAAIGRYGCAACHEIPGIDGARGQVGPSLKGFATRTSVAGVLPNDPASLIRWLRDPQGVIPGNAMPNMGLGEADARDIAAYLYTLRSRG